MGKEIRVPPCEIAGIDDYVLEQMTKYCANHCTSRTNAGEYSKCWEELNNSLENTRKKMEKQREEKDNADVL